MTSYDWWLILVLLIAVVNMLLMIENLRRLRRLMKLDRLLQDICLMAFSLRHAAIWKAWSETMGAIRVTVETSRRRWDADV